MRTFSACRCQRASWPVAAPAAPAARQGEYQDAGKESHGRTNLLCVASRNANRTLHRRSRYIFCALRAQTRRCERRNCGGHLSPCRTLVLPDPLVLIAYGDMRFTRAAETRATNSPAARRALVAQDRRRKPKRPSSSAATFPVTASPPTMPCSAPRRSCGGTGNCGSIPRSAIMNFRRAWNRRVSIAGGIPFRNCAAGAGIRWPSAPGWSESSWTAMPRCCRAASSASWLEGQIDGLDPAGTRWC